MSPVRAPDAVAVIPTEPPLRCAVASSVGSSTTFQRALCTRWSVRSRKRDVATIGGVTIDTCPAESETARRS